MLRKHVDNEPAPAQAPMWMPREGLPSGGREECRNGERPCPYVKCEHHLWMVAGVDRRGRRWTGKELASTLAPRWLEYPTPPCCELDIIELVRDRRTRMLPIALVAYALNLKEWRMRKIIQRALGKLKLLREVGG